MRWVTFISVPPAPPPRRPRSAGPPPPRPPGGGAWGGADVGAPARDVSSGEDRREVPVGDGVVAVGRLNLAGQQVARRRVGRMAFRTGVHERHPGRIDVELHGWYGTGPASA